MRSEKLHKILAACGLGSRREMELAIADGRAKINGGIAEIGVRVDASDKIIFDGKAIRRGVLRRRALLYHKPSGEIVSAYDSSGRRTVFESLPPLAESAESAAGKWINVGRLDLDSEGLLIFTNDGEWANFLAHPRNGWHREYLARVGGEADEKTLSRIRRDGADIGGRRLRPIAIELHGGSGGANRWYRAVVGEGRNRVVRRLFAEMGLEVNRLLRIRHGPFSLPRDLRRGEWREAAARKILQVESESKKN